MAVGIEAINAYVGQACVDVRSLFEHRGLDLSRFENLMMEQRSVNLPCEDAVTNAVNAATPLVAATPVPGMRALVIATDSPGVAVAGSYVEPSEGAGAVAMLVSAQPDVLQLDPGACGYHTFEVMDTLRPRPDVDVVDSDLSLLSYLTCLEQSFLGYRERVRHTDIRETFDHLVFHTPFAGMVRGAHRLLPRKQTSLTPAAIDADLVRRLAPSLAYPLQVGNLF